MEQRYQVNKYPSVATTPRVGIGRPQGTGVSHLVLAPAQTRKTGGGVEDASELFTHCSTTRLPCNLQSQSIWFPLRGLHVMSIFVPLAVDSISHTPYKRGRRGDYIHSAIRDEVGRAVGAWVVGHTVSYWRQICPESQWGGNMTCATIGVLMFLFRQQFVFLLLK